MPSYKKLCPEERRSLAEAAAQRRQTTLATSTADSPISTPLFEAFDSQHERRSQLRRIIDNIILKKYDTAIDSLKQTLARNILNPTTAKVSDPNQVFKFNINSERVKKLIMAPPGVLQFSIEMGFRREVTEAQHTYRVWDKKSRKDLILCSHLLEEAMKREHSRLSEKLAHLRKVEEEEEIRNQTKKIIYDDRKTVQLRIAREKLEQNSQSVVAKLS